jgi:hypothetical protein
MGSQATPASSIQSATDTTTPASSIQSATDTTTPATTIARPMAKLSATQPRKQQSSLFQLRQPVPLH